MRKGKVRQYDTEYVRNGACEIFMFVAPLEGWRRAEVTEHRTRKDWGNQIKKLVDNDFPNAEKIVLVMDNLNTHTVGSLYETFSPEEARRIRDKLEIHYTPKHGCSSGHGRNRNKCSGESRAVRTGTNDAANKKSPRQATGY